MYRYYFIDSDGEDTNLQLYSLRQAKLYWAALERDLEKGDGVAHFHERCVFIICTMGLSVSQLLGQNNPTPCDRVPSPLKIFASLIEQHQLDAGLMDQFQDFIDTYDHCRHFGLTNDGNRHWQVSQLTLNQTRKHFKFGLYVWTIVVGLFKGDPHNELDELDLAEVENEP